jgi:hypothetical protein
VGSFEYVHAIQLENLGFCQHLIQGGELILETLSAER